MRRGDIYWVELGPGADDLRPAVIVSNNAANRVAQRTKRGAVTVVPVSSNTRRVLPFQVVLVASQCGMGVDAKAQAEQVRSITADRLRGRAGQLPPTTLKLLDEALRMHLGL